MSFTPLRALVFILLFVATGWAAAPAPAKPEQMKLTAEVRAIFEAKCADCHGPEVPRPKGKFGYALDLKRIAANPKFIVPGKPEASDLYDLVFHDGRCIRRRRTGEGSGEERP